MSCVEAEVLVVVDEAESDCSESRLKHLLGSCGSTQVVEASIEASVVRSVTGCGNTVVDQSNKTSL